MPAPEEGPSGGMSGWEKGLGLEQVKMATVVGP